MQHSYSPIMPLWIKRSYVSMMSLVLVVLMLGVLLPFYLADMQQYTAADIAAHNTGEYLPPVWFPFGPLIFVVAAISRWLLPLTILACGSFLWHFWSRFRQVERMMWCMILMCGVSMTALMWSSLGAAMITWIMT